MAKLEQISKKADFGDYVTISQIFNERHKKLDGETISSSYVGKILRNERQALPGTIASEIVSIAEKYLSQKFKIRKELIAAQQTQITMRV